MMPTELGIIDHLMSIRAIFDFNKGPEGYSLVVSGYGNPPWTTPTSTIHTPDSTPNLDWSRPVQKIPPPGTPDEEHYTEEEKERLRDEIIEDKLEQLALEDPSEYERVLAELQDKAGNEVSEE